MRISKLWMFKFWGSGGDVQRCEFKPGVAKITQLPDELLLHIRSYLSLTSQACLALTCKTFFSFMGDALSSKEFSLLLKIPYGVIWQLRISPRWQLLCSLEDSRWAICFDCIKLRPIHRFSEVQLLLPSSVRHCAYGHGHGIVEICPCIRMTMGDKLKLMAELESSAEISRSEDSHFWHECRTVRDKATVLTQAQPVLQDGCLVFQMQYQITPKHSLPINRCLAKMPLFCCPHFTIWNIFFEERFGRWTRNCEWCSFSVVDITVETVSADENEKRYTLQTTRNLGAAGEMVDENWSQQCDRWLREFEENSD